MNETRIATYLPPWAGAKNTRVVGPDEDSVTLAVTAGTLALEGVTPQRVVVVTRQPALLEGGNSAVICAGLGLDQNTDVVERIGGASAALDAVATASPGTLIIGVDVENGAGAGAIFVGEDQSIDLAARVQRSLPLRARHSNGAIYEDDDNRLMRERGVRTSLEIAALSEKPQVIAGMSAREAKTFTAAPSSELPTSGASSPFFALANLADNGVKGIVAAIEQATLCAVNFTGKATVLRQEPTALEIPRQTIASGPDIKIAFTAYERAFEPKLKWMAGSCNECGTLAMPPRHRCLNCGSEKGWSLTPLPRKAEVYTTSTIHVPVPGLKTPYSLAVVQLEGVDVRVMATVTDAPPGAVDIGDKGTMVFRRVAMRSGVPDYGYAFSPEAAS